MTPMSTNNPTCEKNMPQKETLKNLPPHYFNNASSLAITQSILAASLLIAFYMTLFFSGLRMSKHSLLESMMSITDFLSKITAFFLMHSQFHSVLGHAFNIPWLIKILQVKIKNTTDFLPVHSVNISLRAILKAPSELSYGTLSQRTTEAITASLTTQELHAILTHHRTHIVLPTLISNVVKRLTQRRKHLQQRVRRQQPIRTTLYAEYSHFLDQLSSESTPEGAALRHLLKEKQAETYLYKRRRTNPDTIYHWNSEILKHKITTFFKKNSHLIPHQDSTLQTYISRFVAHHTSNHPYHACVFVNGGELVTRFARNDLLVPLYYPPKENCCQTQHPLSVQVPLHQHPQAGTINVTTPTAHSKRLITYSTVLLFALIYTIGPMLSLETQTSGTISSAFLLFTYCLMYKTERSLGDIVHSLNHAAKDPKKYLTVDQSRIALNHGCQ